MSTSKLTITNVSIEVAERKRKLYVKPLLTQFGSIATLTLGGGSPCVDGNSTNTHNRNPRGQCGQSE